jgi:3-oxoacyl-[acyl-carrier-protein] synthase II
MRIAIAGVGYRSPLGNLARTWERILSGETAIRIDRLVDNLPELPLATIGSYPQEPLALTLELIAEVVTDGGLTLPAPECGIAIGSSRANQVVWERLAAHPEYLKDINWLDTLPHSLAVACSRYIGSQSALIAPMAACATGIWSICQGVELIRSGACQRAIAGAIEAPISPLTIAGFNRMGALASTGCYPFSKRREGLVLGEGGALFLLESWQSAIDRGARIYGEILGWGLSADAMGICAPDPQATGAVRAVKTCLLDSNLEPNEIDYIHAHGTGTQLNDRQEQDVIEAIFDRGIPLSSTKGATGHTLGASGALGAGICLQAMSTQILPPSVGSIEPEFDLNIITRPTPARIDRTLCLSFGFGGQNAAIVFGSNDDLRRPDLQ